MSEGKIWNSSGLHEVERALAHAPEPGVAVTQTPSTSFLLTSMTQGTSWAQMAAQFQPSGLHSSQKEGGKGKLEKGTPLLSQAIYWELCTPFPLTLCWPHFCH